MVTALARLGGEILARSWSLEVVGEEHVRALRQAGIPVLFAVWHAHLLAPLWHRRDEGITLLVSGHRDGRRLAFAAQRWGYEAAHGSSTRGGADGLRRLVRALRAGGDGAVTPDGPQGPPRAAKDGVLLAASRAAGAIIPIGVRSATAWRARSWDRFQVPAPFSRVRIAYGAPVPPPRAGEPRDWARERLEAALQAAEEEAQCTA
jgi:lysophospholipid acyltransferase (LPLAT)-like uncharacterized protein